MKEFNFCYVGYLLAFQQVVLLATGKQFYLNHTFHEFLFKFSLSLLITQVRMSIAAFQKLLYFVILKKKIASKTQLCTLKYNNNMGKICFLFY